MLKTATESKRKQASLEDTWGSRNYICYKETQFTKGVEFSMICHVLKSHIKLQQPWMSLKA